MAEGLRPITVDGQKFRWRFNERLVVIQAGTSSPQLVVDWGWKDWLGPEGIGGNEPLIVTPKFVAAAIRFALANGWQSKNLYLTARPPYEFTVRHTQ